MVIHTKILLITLIQLCIGCNSNVDKALVEKETNTKKLEKEEATLQNIAIGYHKMQDTIQSNNSVYNDTSFMRRYQEKAMELQQQEFVVKDLKEKIMLKK